MNGDLEIVPEQRKEEAEKLKETANMYFKSRFSI